VWRRSERGAERYCLSLRDQQRNERNSNIRFHLVYELPETSIDFYCSSERWIYPYHDACGVMCIWLILTHNRWGTQCFFSAMAYVRRLPKFKDDNLRKSLLPDIQQSLVIFCLNPLSSHCKSGQCRHLITSF
jgi:hypothetical protein